MSYNAARHKTEIDAIKQKKVRTVDFCDVLEVILKEVKSNSSKTV